ALHLVGHDRCVACAWSGLVAYLDLVGFFRLAERQAATICAGPVRSPQPIQPGHCRHCPGDLYSLFYAGTNNTLRLLTTQFLHGACKHFPHPWRIRTGVGRHITRGQIAPDGDVVDATPGHEAHFFAELPFLTGWYTETLNPHLRRFVIVLTGTEEGLAEHLGSGDITAVPQGIGISREDIEMGIGRKEMALALQAFEIVVVWKDADDVLQAIASRHGSHVANKCHDGVLLALSYLSALCGGEGLAICGTKMLLTARTAAAPQALGA